MKLLTKVNKFLDETESDPERKAIRDITNTALVNRYYETLGVDSKTTFIEWITGVAEGKYPEYTKVLTAIKTIRKLRPEFKKQSRSFTPGKPFNC